MHFLKPRAHESLVSKLGRSKRHIDERNIISVIAAWNKVNAALWASLKVDETATESEQAQCILVVVVKGANNPSITNFSPL